MQKSVPLLQKNKKSSSKSLPSSIDLQWENWEPTIELRWKNVKTGLLSIHKTMLQQKWIEKRINAVEWRNVPIAADTICL